MEINKLPPHSIELEEAVLGAILLESSCLDEFITDFNDEVFYKDANKLIARGIISLYNRNEPIDILTITQELKQKGTLTSAGGAYYVTQLTNRVASTSNVIYHNRILIQFYLKRELIKISNKSLQSAYSEESDVLDCIDFQEKEITRITSQIITNKIVDSQQLYSDALKRNELLVSNKNAIIGVSSGFIDIDKLTGGWQKSDLIILAARPAMGKTSLALEFLKNPSIKYNVPTAIFSLEMSNQQLYSRLQAQESTFMLEDILRKGLNGNDLISLNKQCEKLRKAPIYFEDTGGISIFELRNKARKLKRDKGIELLVIDYLQLITTNNKGSRENEVSEISKALKTLAKELQIPIICLSQLSRAVEQRGGDKIPMLSDLRDSGSIEQDADIVIFIYRPEYYGINEDADGNSTMGKAMIMFAKHRNGGLDNVTLSFIQRQTKFYDIYKPIDTNTSNLQSNENFLNEINKPIYTNQEPNF